MKRCARLVFVTLLLGIVISTLVDHARAVPVAIRRTSEIVCDERLFGNEFLGGAYELVNDYVPASQQLFVFEPDSLGLATSRRSLRQVVGWNRMPCGAKFGSVVEESFRGYVLIEKTYAELTESLRSKGFELVASSGPWLLYSPFGHMVEKGQSEKCFVNASIELLALVAFVIMLLVVYRLGGILCCMLLMVALSLLTFLSVVVGCLEYVTTIFLLMFAAVLVVALHSRPIKKMQEWTLIDGCLVLLVAVILFAYSLSQYLPTPNGASVIGGKAKLITLIGRFPDLFWTEKSDFEDMMPWYPPGLAMIVLAFDKIMDMPLCWALQASGVAIIIIIMREVLRCVTVPICRLAVLAFFLLPVTRQVSASYYSEGFEVLCLMAGMQRLSVNPYSAFGALLAGLAGWFKVEGALFAIVTVALFAPFHISWKDIRFWRSEAFAVLPILLWLMFLGVMRCPMRSVCEMPRAWGGIGESVLCMLKVLLSYDIFPMAIILTFVIFLHSENCRVRYKDIGVRWGVITFLLFATLVVIYAISSPVGVAWHVRTSLPRLVWVWALIMIVRVSVPMTKTINDA